MPTNQIDRLARSLAAGQTRRGVWRGLAGGLAFLTPGFQSLSAGSLAAAADCRKSGNACKRSRQCCSGLCRRRKCRRAPGQGSCTRDRNFCVDGLNQSFCGQTSDGDPCVCLVTRQGASFCADAVNRLCFPCAKDADCATVTGPGSACIRARPPFCPTCSDEGGFCAPRCSG